MIITDNANHTAYGTMTVVTKTEFEEYTVTVNAPVEFLMSSATVYPVIVDPTFTINEQKTITTPDGDISATAIEDIYSGSSYRI